MLERYFSIFTDKFDEDNRIPSELLNLPGELGVLAYLPLRLDFWILSFVYLGIQTLTNCAVAVVAYKFVVQRQGTTSSYLFAYGVICPTLLYLPFVMIEALDLRNISFILCVAGATPALLLFRCIEAAHGTLPRFATRSQRSFILYYAGTMQFRFDEHGEPIILTKAETYAKAKRFFSVVVQTSLLYSILIPRNYVLFHLATQDNSLVRLFGWRSIINNLSMAALTSLTLEAGASGLGLLTSLVTGISTLPFSDSPLTKSESPSDFWGRRWNQIVGSGLRRGIYSPARKAGFGRLVGSGLTFVVSGLLHEYMLLMMTVSQSLDRDIGKAVLPRYGNHLIFFGWCGMVLVLESFLSNHPFIVKLKDTLPQPARTFLVLLTVLPIGHFFCDEYIANSFYDDISLGFPQLKTI